MECNDIGITARHWAEVNQDLSRMSTETINACYDLQELVGIESAPLPTMIKQVCELVTDLKAKLVLAQAVGPKIVWHDKVLEVQNVPIYRIYDVSWSGNSQVVQINTGKIVAIGTNFESAQKLAELIFGYNPGGIWLLNGSELPLDAVLIVAKTVPLRWAPKN